MLVMNAAGVARKIIYNCPTVESGLPHPGWKTIRHPRITAIDIPNAAAIFPNFI